MAIDAVAAGKVNLKGIFTACRWFCFAKTKEVVTPPVKESIPIGVQLKAAVQNKPYLIALAVQFLFGVTHYGRSANLMYYFKYVEGNEALFVKCFLYILHKNGPRISVKSSFS